MRILQEALTFDDVLLVPGHSAVQPKSVQLSSKLTRNIDLNIPLISSAMDTVTEARLAIALAQEGGLGIIHKNMTVEAQAEEVRRVKKFESGIVSDPISVTPDTTIQELLALNKAHKISGVPVVEGEELVGIVTSRDIRFVTEESRPVSEFMTSKERLITAKEGTPKEEVVELLHKHRIEKVLMVDEDFNLKGLMTVKDLQKAKEKPSACKDNQGRLRCGGAVGTGPSTDERVAALVNAGVDVIVVDTAHGHAQSVLDRVKQMKTQYPRLDVIGGNVATPEAADALVAAGADAVKVGIGPGSICTTRIVTGVGVPQFTAICNVVEGLGDKSVPVIADGGIRFSGDIAKAIAAGASTVMMGSLFAGTEESPGEFELFQNRTYKIYRGMGSIAAMAQEYGSSDRYFQAENDTRKLVPEGIEGRIPYKGSLHAIVYQLIGGLRSAMGYTGCSTIDEFKTKPHFVKISPASVRESHAHDITITKDAPNYWVE